MHPKSVVSSTYPLMSSAKKNKFEIYPSPPPFKNVIYILRIVIEQSLSKIIFNWVCIEQKALMYGISLVIEIRSIRKLSEGKSYSKFMCGCDNFSIACLNNYL